MAVRTPRSSFEGHLVALAVAALAFGALELGCEEKRKVSTGASLAPSATLAAPTSPGAPSSTSTPAFDPQQLNLFAAIPDAVEKPTLDEKTKLGQALFFDARLSRGQDVACSSCHELSKSGADGAVFSRGTKKQQPRRNTPTIFNAGGAFAWGWDARATSIEDFVVLHLLDPAVMGMGEEKRLVETIESIPTYATSFAKAFPDEKPPISAETVGQSLGAYTKKLFARSRWDRYLAGETSALEEEELRGLAMFVEAGCTSCHQGKYLGATQTQKLGMARPWPPPAGAELGRFEVTKQEVDRGMWKVPSLRNVTRTAPYLHDGSIGTLEEATRLMARHQVGRELSEPQVQAIVTFFRTLEGDPPKVLTIRPALPPGGPKTPRPD